ncbi:MAG TPA: NAD(P)/FAD-dependent oxidoreductase [Steroidobacteraceae bacterium]|nr:NAD(P)/FAD-dependent oxidoreductase [Steroidobacteraceae bacterium]
MSALRAQPVSLVGAGLAGALLALLLARRGFAVTLYDRRSDPRRAASAAGRSINLALAARGIRALERAAVMPQIEPLLIAMRGRMLHDRLGKHELQRYGRTAQEVIYSVDRAALNSALLDAATRHPQVAARFEQTCLGANLATDVLSFRDLASGLLYERPLTPTIATDGAGSAVRASLAAAQAINARAELLDHDYKELTLPAQAGRHALDPAALHIWPRGGFMLIALPNIGGSFTATLFLPRTGAASFGALTAPARIREFCAREFPDAAALMPDLVHEFTHHPLGQLGTVHSAPWHVGGRVLLLGDAAHAIFPFHGQGMNAAFEDCLVFDDLLDEHADWALLFNDFEQRRRPNAEAIAQMSLENYEEMRATVMDPTFKRHQQLALELEGRFPDRFIRRYSMVMFHPEIPYAEALRRGAVQAEIIAAIDRDPARAAALIEERLPRIG